MLKSIFKDIKNIIIMQNGTFFKMKINEYINDVFAVYMIVSMLLNLRTLEIKYSRVKRML